MGNKACKTQEVVLETKTSEIEKEWVFKQLRQFHERKDANGRTLILYGEHIDPETAGILKCSRGKKDRKLNYDQAELYPDPLMTIACFIKHVNKYFFLFFLCC